MAVYDQIISRTDAIGLIPGPAVLEIEQALARTSIAFELFNRVPMSTGQGKVPLASELPVAYWVNGDTGLKQTAKMSWDGLMLTAEELAVLVPVPEAVVADVGRDLWSLVRPKLAEAIGARLDAACVFGSNRPASFAQGIVPGAAAASPDARHRQRRCRDGDGRGAGSPRVPGRQRQRHRGEGELRSAVRGALQALGGAATFGPAPQGNVGLTARLPRRLAGVAGELADISGDWSAAILGVRQDITYKLLDQAVISDDAGKVIFNLPQQDSVALRAVARYGFQVAQSVYQDAAGPRSWPTRSRRRRRRERGQRAPGARARARTAQGGRAVLHGPRPPDGRGLPGAHRRRRPRRSSPKPTGERRAASRRGSSARPAGCRRTPARAAGLSAPSRRRRWAWMRRR